MTNDDQHPRRPNFRDMSEDQWREFLGAAEFAVLRQAATEPPGTNEFLGDDAVGVYYCAGCGLELFRSATKFHSGCGWPAFYAPQDSDAVVLRPDDSLGRRRTEVLCAGCGGHLGHVFEGEGFNTPTDQRFCINSVALRFSDS